MVEQACGTGELWTKMGASGEGGQESGHCQERMSK